MATVMTGDTSVLSAQEKSRIVESIKTQIGVLERRVKAETNQAIQDILEKDVAFLQVLAGKFMV